MPYYFGEGDPGWDEYADDGGRAPKASQFRYLAPPDLGGPPAPVRFSDEVPPPQTAPPSPTPAASSLLDRLLGRRPPAAAATARPTWEERQRERERQSQHWLALTVAALREVGANRAYGRYDGGNDEGFAWLEHVELASGERLTPDAAAARLAKTALGERLAAAGLWHSSWPRTTRQLRDIALSTFADDCAARLLGRGFGTGPFYMYGAFTVDVDTCTITDDRDAGPVVANINLEL